MLLAGPVMVENAHERGVAKLGVCGANVFEDGGDLHDDDVDAHDGHGDAAEAEAGDVSAGKLDHHCDRDEAAEQDLVAEADAHLGARDVAVDDSADEAGQDVHDHECARDGDCPRLRLAELTVHPASLDCPGERVLNLLTAVDVVVVVAVERLDGQGLVGTCLEHELELGDI